MIIDSLTIIFSIVGVGLSVWILWNHDKFVPDEAENITHHHSRQPYHPDHEE